MSDVAVRLPATPTVNVALTVPTVGLIATTGPNEIVISSTEPTDPFVEMWWKPDTVAALWDSGSWDSTSWV